MGRTNSGAGRCDKVIETLLSRLSDCELLVAKGVGEFGVPASNEKMQEGATSPIRSFRRSRPRQVYETEITWHPGYRASIIFRAADGIVQETVSTMRRPSNMKRTV